MFLVPPNFQVCHHQDPYNKTVFSFCLDQQTIPLAKNESGVICIDATATGYPNPQYYWEYFVDGLSHEVEDDPCLQRPHSDGNKNTGKENNAAAVRPVSCMHCGILHYVPRRRVVSDFGHNTDWLTLRRHMHTVTHFFCF